MSLHDRFKGNFKDSYAANILHRSGEKRPSIRNRESCSRELSKRKDRSINRTIMEEGAFYDSKAKGRRAKEESTLNDSTNRPHFYYKRRAVMRK
jgi:hypothetical protein